MSSKKYATPLRLTPNYSQRFFVLLLTVYLAAAVCLYALSIPVSLQFVAVLVLLFSFYYTYRMFIVLKCSNSIVAAVWEEGSEWLLSQKNGRVLSAKLLPTSFFYPGLVVLNFKIAESIWSRSLVIFPDSLDGQSFRRLRVRLTLVKGKLHRKENPED